MIYMFAYGSWRVALDHMCCNRENIILTVKGAKQSEATHVAVYMFIYSPKAGGLNKDRLDLLPYLTRK